MCPAKTLALDFDMNILTQIGSTYFYLIAEIQNISEFQTSSVL